MPTYSQQKETLNKINNKNVVLFIKTFHDTQLETQDNVKEKVGLFSPVSSNWKYNLKSCSTFIHLFAIIFFKSLLSFLNDVQQNLLF